MTLSPCRTLQNVIHTQKCVLCREYAKPNRCVFKCLAKVSKSKEEDLKSFYKKLFVFVQNHRYEVKFQNGLECGGAYIKLLTEDNNLDLVIKYNCIIPVICC